MVHKIETKTPDEMNAIHDALVLVIEECSEVTKNITKAFRGGLLFTMEDKSNVDLIIEEMIDLEVVTDIFKELIELTVDRDKYVTMYNAKLDKLKIWSELGHVLPKIK